MLLAVLAMTSILPESLTWNKHENQGSQNDLITSDLEKGSCFPMFDVCLKHGSANSH